MGSFVNQIFEKASRFKEEVESVGGELIAVSKTFSSEKIREAHGSGIEDFGENYINEAVSKIEELSDLNIKWHYLGRIQSGNLNKLLNRFFLIQTVASLSHLGKINKKTKFKQRVLIQIKHRSDARDYGVDEKDLKSFIEEALMFENVILSGLMFIPPVDTKEESLEAVFLWAKEVFDRLRGDLPDPSRCEWKVLSMGMSGDYKKALAVGATHVRLGRALFGER